MPFYRNFPGRNFTGRNFHNMKKQFERMYDEFMQGEEDPEEIFDIYPATNVEETDAAFIFTMELPGVKKNEVKIIFDDNALTISGEKKEDADAGNRQFSRYERDFGKFYRKFSVSSNIKGNKINAEFSDGLLIVTLPKDKTASSAGININIK